jgi:peptidoglycan/xylan/chitin deacetylase (PgdA/CDA1 family)
VAITFDDGYADNYEYAFPVLARYNAPACFFLIAGLMEADPVALERQKILRFADEGEVQPMNWDDVQRMKIAGMSFGAHTYSHPNLVTLSNDEAFEEISRSKEIIERRLGETIHSMAYPFGKKRLHFDDNTVRIVRECGFAAAGAILFRAVKSSDPMLAIPRFFVANDDLDTFKDKVYGAWDLVGRIQETAPLWLARKLSGAALAV